MNNILLLSLFNKELVDYTSLQTIETDVIHEIIKLTRTYEGDNGIIYSRSMDNYFYLRNINKGDKNYLLAILLPITNSVSFYFNENNINEFIDSNLNNLTSLDISERKAGMTALMKFLDQITGNEAEIYSTTFNEDLFKFLMENFENYLIEIIFALILNIPVVFTNVNNEAEFTRMLKQINPYLKIGNTTDTFQHIYLNIKDYNFSEYICLDLQKHKFNSTLNNEISDIFKDQVIESIELHREGFISIEISINIKILWFIQKVYGVLALTDDIIDYSNYLHEEDLGLKPMLERLYINIAYAYKHINL